MCKVEWCSGKPNVSGRGYCRKHYDQIRKYGKILDVRSILGRDQRASCDGVKGDKVVPWHPEKGGGHNGHSVRDDA